MREDIEMPGREIEGGGGKGVLNKFLASRPDFSRPYVICPAPPETVDFTRIQTLRV